MSYMRTLTIHVKQNDPLFPYAEKLTALANNLSNAARFRQRQLLTASGKVPALWTENEQDVVEELMETFPEVFRDGLENKGMYLNAYGHLEKLMRTVENPDYFADGFPRQCSQQILKQAARDMKSFVESLRAYQKSPESFTGKPQLPSYKRKGGHTTVLITNQDCTIKTIHGKWYAALPLNKKEPLPLGYPIRNARLKEVTITPDNGRYRFDFKFEVQEELPDLLPDSGRICAIDFGVDNLMAVTNNCDRPCLLYKGGAVKSVNQFYNKTIAKMVSEQMTATGKKFIPTAEYYAVTNFRNDKVNDYLHKCAKHLVSWCVENRIDTMVLGVNPLWKQEVKLGHVNNQKFVQLPITKLRLILKYLCEWNGIRYVEQEESYTSKASFLDTDPLPVYGKETETLAFSGKRRPTRYQGMYKKDGFRGLYTSGDGTVINSDLNGSANILRKAFPDAFHRGSTPNFQNVIVIKHPDAEAIKENRRQQLFVFRPVSHAKQKRQNRKALAS